ncbi:PTS sugar transporter subunit IIA [candidate division WOR-3 bacterium]|nr:PTS sugar transporter subunit IIA [candidate division WOR-3 bacterium]
MELKDYIDENLISLHKSKKKEKILLELINSICKNKELGNKKEIKEAIFHREKLMSTGIGLGIAVPHARIRGITELVMAVGVCKEGINDYETLDDIPVSVVVLILAGEGQHKTYIQVLSLIVSKLKKSEVRESLINAKNEKELYEILVS